MSRAISALTHMCGGTQIDPENLSEEERAAYEMSQAQNRGDKAFEACNQAIEVPSALFDFVFDVASALLDFVFDGCQSRSAGVKFLSMREELGG
eukprot:1442339-Rhodomonas_salina.1